MVGAAPASTRRRLPSPVEYGDGEEGYVCLSFIARKWQEFERPYVEAKFSAAAVACPSTEAMGNGALPSRTMPK